MRKGLSPVPGPPGRLRLRLGCGGKGSTLPEHVLPALRAFDTRRLTCPSPRPYESGPFL